MTEPDTPDSGEDDEFGTALEDLRELHTKLAGQHRKTIPVPGYRGRLCIRYQPPQWAESKQAVRVAAGDEPRADINAVASELVSACVGVFLRSPTTGRLKQISQGFGPDVAEHLGFEATGTARGNLFAIFGDPEPSDDDHDDNGAAVRVDRHHDLFLAWASGRLNDDEDDGVLHLVDEEFVGE